MQIQNPTVSAIPLIYYDQTLKRFKVNDNAISFINKIPKPISIVSIVGLYRTGKSYLLNKMLLNRSHGGFQVGSTINACTKGLWIWPEIIEGKNENNETINILIIDTQGIGSLQEDSNHDVKIFILGILLSSCFIYTSIGAIESSRIEDLSLVVHLTQSIQKKLSSKIQSPDFIWILRDFNLNIVDQEGNSLTSNQYLQKALTQQKSINQLANNRNNIRRCIKQFFQHRQCITFTRPTFDSNLQNLMTVPLQKLRSQFSQTLLRTRNRLLSKANVKRFGNQDVDGSILKMMIIQYTQAINSDSIPNIMGAWDYINDQLQNRCLEQICVAIQNQIQKIEFPMNNNTLQKTLNELKELVIQKLQSLSQKTKNSFNQYFQKKQKLINIKNNKLSKQFIVTHLDRKFKLFYTFSTNNALHLQDFKQSFISFQNQASKQLSNFSFNNKNQVITQWKLKNYQQQWNLALKVLKNKLMSEIQINKSMTVMLKQQTDKLKQQMTYSKNKHEHEILNLKNEKLKLQYELSIHQQRINTFKTQSSQNEGQFINKELSLKQIIEEIKKQNVEYVKSNELLKQQIEFLSIKNKQLQNKYNEAKKSEMHYLSIISNTPVENKIIFDDSALKQINKQQSVRLKERITLLQKRIKQIQNNKNELQVKVSILSQHKNTLELQIQNIQKQFKDKQKDYQQKIHLLKQQLSQLKQTCESTFKKLSQLQQQFQQLSICKSDSKQTNHTINNLDQLKLFYEQEKQERAKYIEQQKSKLQANYKIRVDEIEKQYKLQIKQLISNKQMLQNQLHQKQDVYEHYSMLQTKYNICKEDYRSKQRAVIQLQKSKTQLQITIKSITQNQLELKQEISRSQQQHKQNIQKILEQVQIKNQLEYNRLKQQIISLKDKIQQIEARAHSNERQYLKQINNEQMNNAVALQKYISLENKYKNNQFIFEEQKQSLKAQLKQTKAKLTDINKLYTDLKRNMDEKIEQLEAEKDQIESDYDNDKILWKSKIDFVEQQKQSQKIHYQQKIQKLEQALEFASRNQENHTYQRIVNQVNKKYQYGDSILGTIVSNTNDQKITRKWQQQIKQLKNQKQRMMTEYQKVINTQKQLRLIKVKQMQDRLKQAEYRKQMVVNQHEQQRNNWQLFGNLGINKELVYVELRKIWTIVVCTDILINLLNYPLRAIFYFRLISISKFVHCQFTFDIVFLLMRLQHKNKNPIKMNFKKMNDKNTSKSQLKYQTKQKNLKSNLEQLQFTLNQTHRKISETMVFSSSTMGKSQENVRNIINDTNRLKIDNELEGLKTVYHRKNTVKSLIPQSQQQPQIAFIQSQIKAKMQRKRLLYSMNLRLDRAATQRQVKKNIKNNSKQIDIKQNQVFKQIFDLEQLIAQIKTQAQQFFYKQKKLSKYSLKQQQIFKTNKQHYNPSQKTHKKKAISLLQAYPSTNNKLKHNFYDLNKHQQTTIENKVLINNQQYFTNRNLLKQISESPIRLLDSQLAKSIVTMDYESKYSLKKYM